MADMDNIDLAIMALRDAGKSFREIGEVVGMSHVAVQKRLAKAERASLSYSTVAMHSIAPGDYVEFVNLSSGGDGKKEWIQLSQHPDLANALGHIDEVMEEIITIFQPDWGKLRRIAVRTPGGWKIEGPGS